MTDIALYVDPVCPFSWVTARWLQTSADARVTLRQMSLAVLNEGQDVDADHRPMIERSRRLGRVFAAVTRRYGDDGFDRLYQEFGTVAHTRKEPITDETIAAMLARLDLDPALAEAADDARLDESVAETHQAAQQVLGQPSGSPIAVVEGRGFSGPVLTKIPDPQQGKQLFEALVTLAATPAFAAVQSPYSGPPDATEPAAGA
ncbi:disulfide bond formation protein DsbA [Nocardia nova]|uniref:Disulfide bond formation protein DsbA n=1 Tax=Nocardia nova TaxID=37330 RepID=A0A2S6AUJ4_9NOCA|nr:disulfide bond formation protein DsbA [Nocardia nova]PPJ31022.1 disulfide bond formation protein DsbA [Nocardia nova]PPJ38901.1 disulfide bond formation protein DsbA [Nocardia nova]